MLTDAPQYSLKPSICRAWTGLQWEWILHVPDARHHTKHRASYHRSFVHAIRALDRWLARLGTEYFCGCCGRGLPTVGIWCEDCLQHVVASNRPPWERTYFAQHGVDCPHVMEVAHAE